MTAADYYERAFPGEFWIDLPGSSQDIICRLVETCEDGFEAEYQDLTTTIEELEKEIEGQMKQFENLVNDLKSRDLEIADLKIALRDRAQRIEELETAQPS